MTREEIEEKMDELARKSVETHRSPPLLDGISEAIDNMTVTAKELGKLWVDTNSIN
jgi:hypothetical protein